MAAAVEAAAATEAALSPFVTRVENVAQQMAHASWLHAPSVRFAAIFLSGRELVRQRRRAKKAAARARREAKYRKKQQQRQKEKAQKLDLDVQLQAQAQRVRVPLPEASLVNVEKSRVDGAAITVSKLGAEELLFGQDKWLGGELSLRNGCIYGVPGSARTILKISLQAAVNSDTSSSMRNSCAAAVSVSQIPLPADSLVSSLSNGRFKWLRGISAPDGAVYAIPSNAKSVLRIEPADGAAHAGDFVSTFGGPFEGTWKWHGGVLAPDGAIYCIPCNAERVLKVVPGLKPTAELIGPVLPGRNKWYGGLLGQDGCIYGIPNCATTVLKIQPNVPLSAGDSSEGVSTFGTVQDGFGKWHGGVVAADGSIIGIPAFANRVLRICPSDQTVEKIGPELSTVSDRYRRDARYKYGGGVLGPDGAVYAFPSDADFPLRIVAHERTVEVLSCHGAPGTGTDATLSPGNGSRRDGTQTGVPTPFVPSHNKWQNGFVGKDGAVYAIPCNAPAVLRIAVPNGDAAGAPHDARKETVVELVGKAAIARYCGQDEEQDAPSEGDGPAWAHDKWEGGVVGLDGALYCMPQNSKFVLRVDGRSGSVNAVGGETESL